MKLSKFTSDVKSILIKSIEEKIHIKIRNREAYSFNLEKRCSICNTVTIKFTEIENLENERTLSEHEKNCIVKKYIEVYNLIKNHEIIKPGNTTN